MITMKLIIRSIIGLVMALSFTTSMAQAVDLTKTTIVYQKSESALVGHMAEVLANDIERVSGIRPEVSRVTGLSGQSYVLGKAKAAIGLSTAGRIK